MDRWGKHLNFSTLVQSPLVIDTSGWMLKPLEDVLSVSLLVQGSCSGKEAAP